MKEIRTVRDSVSNISNFLCREYDNSNTFESFIQSLEDIEVFKWVEEKKILNFNYNGDIVVEINILPFFRDYQLEKILK